VKDPSHVEQGKITYFHASIRILITWQAERNAGPVVGGHFRSGTPHFLIHGQYVIPSQYPRITYDSRGSSGLRSKYPPINFLKTQTAVIYARENINRNTPWLKAPLCTEFHSYILGGIQKKQKQPSLEKAMSGPTKAGRTTSSLQAKERLRTCAHWRLTAALIESRLRLT
jgi:hypothetical protein